MEAFAVPDLPEIEVGDDLAALIEARADLEDGDVVAVASTVVSKAKGRTASLADFDPGDRAVDIAEQIERATGEQKDPRFAQAVIEESTDLLIESPFLLAVTPFGHVGVNAGIDKSNTGSAELLLLPKEPTASAAKIRDELEADVAVIVTDTSGRPFRNGQRGVALGWAGLPAMHDWRGGTDRDGRKMEVTVEAIVDELAATANLIAGEGAGGTPVTVIRNVDYTSFEGSDDLFRSVESDFVRQALKEWSHEGN